MSFYEIITFITLINLPFFPSQDSIWVRYIVFAYAAYLLPRALVILKGIPKQVRDDRVRWAFLLFLIIATISTFFSTNIQSSFVQLLLFFSYFVIYITSGEVFDTLQKKERLGLVLIGITVVLSTISLYNTLIVHYTSKLSRGVSFMWVYFGHNHLSALLLFSIPLSFYFLRKYWDKKYLKVFLVICSLLLVISLIMTFARGSIISLVISGIISLYIFNFSYTKNINRIVILWFLIVFLVGAGISTRIKSLEFDINKPMLSERTRFTYAQEAIQNGINHIFTGTGLDTFKNKNTSNTWYVHNFYFQIFSDTGVIGLLSGLLLIIFVLWNIGKSSIENQGTDKGLFSAMLWIGLFASSINAFVDFDWQLPTVFFIFWLLAGLGN